MDREQLTNEADPDEILRVTIPRREYRYEYTFNTPGSIGLEEYAAKLQYLGDRLLEGRKVIASAQYADYLLTEGSLYSVPAGDQDNCLALGEYFDRWNELLVLRLEIIGAERAALANNTSRIVLLLQQVRRLYDYDEAGYPGEVRRRGKALKHELYECAKCLVESKTYWAALERSRETKTPLIFAERKPCRHRSLPMSKDQIARIHRGGDEKAEKARGRDHRSFFAANDLQPEDPAKPRGKLWTICLDKLSEGERLRFLNRPK